MVDNYSEHLHQSAMGRLFQFARHLRKFETNAEKLLWKELRKRKLNGVKFRRQHPLDSYIADFYCHEKRLVIELDGSIHNAGENKQYDDARSNDLNELGNRIIRFSNDEVEEGLEKVLEKIREALDLTPLNPLIHTSPPNPFSFRRGGIDPD